MTSAEWDRCEDHRKLMEELLDGRAGDRKLRLFVCACYRRRTRFCMDRHRRVVELGERYADGGATREELWEAVRGLAAADAPPWVWLAVSHNITANMMPVLNHESWPGTGDEVLFRCVFGNPFRPPRPLSPAVLAYHGGAARRLAESVYAGRRFERLPVLADLLGEAGATDAELLGHLRSPGPHVLGCQALDAILGKS